VHDDPAGPLEVSSSVTDYRPFPEETEIPASASAGTTDDRPFPSPTTRTMKRRRFDEPTIPWPSSPGRSSPQHPPPSSPHRSYLYWHIFLRTGRCEFRRLILDIAKMSSGSNGNGIRSSKRRRRQLLRAVLYLVAGNTHGAILSGHCQAGIEDLSYFPGAVAQMCSDSFVAARTIMRAAAAAR